MRKIVKALFFSTLIFLLVPLSAVSAQESNDLNTRSGGASVDVTVPSELNILMKADGDNLVSSYEIINNGAPIKLTGIDIQKAGEWSLVSDESQLTPDAHKLIFKLGGTILKEGNNNTDITIKTGETFTPEFSVERGLITKSEETTAFKLTLKYEIIETKLINGSEFNKILLGAIQGKYNKLTFSNKPISHFDTNNIGESYDVSEKQDGSIIMYVITGTTFGEDGLEHSNEIIITNQIERQKIIFNEDSSHMFEMVGGSIDQFIIDGEYADLSLVEDMSYMFAGDYYGEQLFFTGNAQFIDTSTPKLANIDGMFKDAVFSGKMPDLSGLGFSKVESANYLFENVVSQGPFDFSFSDFKSLKFIDGIFKNFGTYYDGVLDTSSLDASNVVSMNEAFKVNSSVNTIKTPININAKAEMNDITDKVWYDETDNYRIYVAGTFLTGNTESHTLVREKPVTYNITYNLDGGTLSEDAPTSYEKGKGLDTLPTPTKKGYKFVGWTSPIEMQFTNLTDKTDYYISRGYEEAFKKAGIEKVYGFYEEDGSPSNKWPKGNGTIVFEITKQGTLSFYDLLFDKPCDGVQSSTLKITNKTTNVSKEYNLNDIYESSLFYFEKLSDNYQDILDNNYMEIDLEKGNYTAEFSFVADDYKIGDSGYHLINPMVTDSISSISTDQTGDIKLIAVWEKSDETKLTDGVNFNSKISSLGSFDSIKFSQETLNAEEIANAVDVSEIQDGSIMAYWMPTTGALVITNQNENFKIKFNENSSYMFYDTSLTLTFDENGTDFSDVETMSYMFAFPEVDPGGTHRISNLSFPQSDTSNLLSTSHMFENAALMDGDKIDLSGLDFSNVEDASYMYASFMLSDGYIDYNWSSFANVKNIEGILKDFFFINIPDDELPVVIDISGLNAYNITNMSYAFNGIRVDAVEDKYDEISIKTPYNIQEAIDTGNISSVNLYDIDDNYKEYPAGTFPTGITESHILTAKAPDQ